VREESPGRQLGADIDPPGERVRRDHLSGKARASWGRRSGTGRGLLASAALAALLVVTGCSDSGRSTEGGYIGTSASRVTVVPADQRKPAATVAGTRLGGKDTISSADHPDKVVVINVWGSWCPPCRQEAPDLEKASRQTKDKAAFIGITTKDYDPAPAEAFVRKFEITYPSIYDPTGNVLLSLAGDLPPSAIPSTLVIDPQGRIAARVLGTISTDSLVDLVDDVAAGK
jgi:thiol-disulfide isomerase/thioredoxin